MKFKLSDLWKDRHQTRADAVKSHTVRESREQRAPETQDQQSPVGQALRQPVAEDELGPRAAPETNMAALLNVKLPPLPNAALRVAELARDINASAPVVADAVGYDPALAARILRAANSSLYSRERHVTALTTAVNVLGLRALYQLAISYAASSLFDTQSRTSLVERMIWRHSVFVGLAARSLSLEFGLHGSEESFLCGLLHDVGKGLMIRHNAELYMPLLEITDDDELLEREREAYGFTHPQMSAQLMNHWGLAAEISDAVLNHHQPDEAAHSILLTRVLNIANQLANTSGFGISQENNRDLAVDESVFLLGLSDERLREIREKAEESMSEMMFILSK